MILIRTLFAHLMRPEVTEVAVVTGRPPCACVGGTFQPIDPGSLSTDDILQLLFSAGGSRHIEALGPKATQWQTRADGVGNVTVAALQQGTTVQARFLMRKEGQAERPATVPRAAPVAPPTPSIQTRESAGGFAKHSMPALRVDLEERVAPASPRVPRFGTPGNVAPPINPVIHEPPPPSDRAGRGRMLDPISLPPPALSEPASAPPYRDSNTAPPYVPAHPRVPSLRADTNPRPPPAAVSYTAQSAAPEPRRIGPPVLSPAVPDLGVVDARGAVPQPRGSAPRGPMTPIIDTRESTPQPPPAAASEPRRERAPVVAAAPPPSARPDPAAARAFKDLLLEARNAGTSDLHIIAGRPALIRTSGTLAPMGEPLDVALVERMLQPRIPARLREVFERDGSCDFALQELGLGRFRVNISRHRGGLKASMRLIPEEIPTLASLGLPDAIAGAVHHHQGLIVITGPTGHGKTTTLAAIVDILNSERAGHIITVEDPVEFIHPRKKAMISQREVGTHTRTFQSALKASLREDPDVIVVGELRDTDTMRMALSASETGHLVIGTMNTPSAAKTIDRIIDLFPPGDQAQVRVTLAGGLRLIVGQRLMPRADGNGLIAAAEVLPGLVALWNLIRDSKTWQIPSLQQRGRGLGIIRLDDSLAELVRSGMVTAYSAIQVAESPEELEAVLGGKRPPANAPLAAPPPAAGSTPGAPGPEGAMKDLLGKAGSLFKRKGP